MTKTLYKALVIIYTLLFVSSLYAINEDRWKIIETERKGNVILIKNTKDFPSRERLADFETTLKLVYTLPSHAKDLSHEEAVDVYNQLDDILFDYFSNSVRYHIISSIYTGNKKAEWVVYTTLKDGDARLLDKAQQLQQEYGMKVTIKRWKKKDTKL